MDSRLFHCPDCQYQCSLSALSCLNCGRIFRVSQTVHTRPPKIPIIWFATFSIVSLVVFLMIILFLNADRKNAEFSVSQSDAESAGNQVAVENRRQFALEKQATVVENSNKNMPDVTYTTEDYLEKSDTLVVTSSALLKKDCDHLANKNDGQAAARLGFNRLICRNRRLGSEWSLQLERTDF